MNDMRARGASHGGTFFPLIFRLSPRALTNPPFPVGVQTCMLGLPKPNLSPSGKVDIFSPYNVPNSGEFPNFKFEVSLKKIKRAILAAMQSGKKNLWGVGTGRLRVAFKNQTAIKLTCK